MTFYYDLEIRPVISQYHFIEIMIVVVLFHIGKVLQK